MYHPPPHHHYHGKNHSELTCCLLPQMILCLFENWAGQGARGMCVIRNTEPQLKTFLSWEGRGEEEELLNGCQVSVTRDE